MPKPNQFKLYLHTLRHLTPRQLAYRFFYVTRRQWWKSIAKKAPTGFKGRLIDFAPLLMGIDAVGSPGPWEEDVVLSIDRAGRLSQNRFCFLHREVFYPKKILWDDPRASRLWRYHLHYFDYVEDLLVWSICGGETPVWKTFRRLAESWIDNNENMVGDGWHPYTISLRIVNWLHALGFWKDRFQACPQFFDRFRQSLFGQVKVLSVSLEHDVRGNHLLKNLRALIIVGCAFDDALVQSSRDRAVKCLKQEIAEQVLADGGHFERTPGYHLAVLKDFLEIGLWLRRGPVEIRYDWLDGAIQKMLDYLRAMVMPDGHLPLVKDTAMDATGRPADVLAAGALYLNAPQYKTADHFGLYPLLLFGMDGWRRYREWQTAGKNISSITMPHSGFHMLRDDSAGDYLIFDTGKVCPDYLPAHAHADLLSYELMINGQPVVVDSGIYEYAAGPWRDFFRSTPAHNTVSVERHNQSEVWSGFRVAQRAKPRLISRQESDGYLLVEAEHDGYCRLPVPVVHRRVLLWVKGRFRLVADRMQGRGRVQAHSYVHLHPDMEARKKKSRGYQLTGRSDSISIQYFGFDESSTVRGREAPFLQGWYSPEFGKRYPNTVITFSKRGELPFCFGYIISTCGNPSVDTRVSKEESTLITIRDDHGVHTLDLGAAAARYFE